MKLLVSTRVRWLLCAFLMLFLSVVHGRCPSNGNNRALYLTTNIGDNILSFDSSGNFLGQVLNLSSLPSDVRVDKLRAMRFGPGGYLYVASAKGSLSRIFAVTGNGMLNHTLKENCTRNYEFTVVQQENTNKFLDHPYDFEFHPETGTLYVANQNSVSITQYTLQSSKGERQDTLHWVPTTNNPHAVGHAVDALGRKINIPDDSSLFASSWSSTYLLTSVRGIAISPLLPRALINGTAGPGLFTRDHLTVGYYLLVCDVAADTVHVFDVETGERLYGLDVPSPIQVRFPSKFFSDKNSVFDTNGNEIMKVEAPYVYVTSKEDGMVYLVHITPHLGDGKNGNLGRFYSHRSKSNNGRFMVTRPLLDRAASGIAEHPVLKTLLVADRIGRSVTSYSSPLELDYENKRGYSTALNVLIKDLPDRPEFLLFALVENQKNIPFCYELGPEGELRYVALCSAARLWSYILGFMGILLLISAITRSRSWFRRTSRSGIKTPGSSYCTPLASATKGSYGGTNKRSD